jgi:hypothetical protein
MGNLLYLHYVGGGKRIGEVLDILRFNHDLVDPYQTPYP